MLRELDRGKKRTAGDLAKKEPGPPGEDFAIRNRLKLKVRKNNTSPSPPLPPPALPFLPPLPPPPPPSFPFNLPSPPQPQPSPTYIFFSPQLPLPPPSSSSRFPTQASNNLFSLLFDTSKINEEVIMDKITESVSDPLNDTYYVDHPPPGTNSFTLKREGGRYKNT